jgi:3-dehydroquinate dehydratase / shikimate dehydrogenase
VTGRDVQSIRHARSLAERDADLVELRLDSMERPDAAAALSGRRKPAIATCRPPREGGMFEGSEEERLAILRDAHAAGAEFIDVEWDADARALIAERGGRGMVISKHDFARTPPDAAAELGRLRAAGGEVAKLAVRTESLADIQTLLSAVKPDRSSVLIGMGACGIATRILAARFGSRWTYAGDGVAPGQLPAKRLLQEYRFRRIQPDAAVYVLLGRPIAHSLSPAMHNAGFAALGLNAVYVPVEAPDVADFHAFAAAMGVRGASVTIPFKRDALRIAHEVTPFARAAGAVNTLVLRDGRWIGSNTDADGFLEPLRARMPSLSGRRCVVLGAGGAARAVALTLVKQGARVAISARRADAAKSTAREVGGEAASWPPPRGSWDVLINATPVGSRAQPGLPVTSGLDGELVYDLVYEPEPTELMARAEATGCAVIGGLEMLVAQAERQFEIWTGQRPPAGLFAEAAAQARAARQEI